MGACSSECPVVQTLLELQIGASELSEAGLLKNDDVRIATIGLCRALLEVGECESGPLVVPDFDGGSHAWIECRNSQDVNLSGLCDVVGAHSDSGELNIRKEAGTARVAKAFEETSKAN